MKKQAINEYTRMSESTGYDLKTILKKYPHLGRVIEEIRKHVSAYHVCDADALSSIPGMEEYQGPLIICGSQRIKKKWPYQIDEADVLLDLFEESWDDSMSYMVWNQTGRGTRNGIVNGVGIGIKLEEIQAVFQRYPKASELHVGWITKDELVINSINIDYFAEIFEIAEEGWRISRHILDAEYIAAKTASFPPALADDEKRILHGAGNLVHIAKAINIGQI